MRLGIVRIGLAMVVGMACCAAAAAQEGESAEQTAAPRLELSSRVWDFGTIWQGYPKPTGKVTVKNVGDAPLEITEVKSSCGCTVPSKPKSPLAPGESDEMTVTFDSIKRRGPQNQTLTLITNDPRHPKMPFQVRGTIKPVYEVKPIGELSFGKIFEDTQATQSVEIINKYTEKLALKLAKGQEYAPFSIELRETEPGQRYELRASTMPPLEVGVPHVQVKMETGLKRLPEITITVYGNVRPPIVVERKQLFLSKRVARETEQVVRVVFAPGQPVKIRSVHATHDAIKTALRDPTPHEIHSDQLMQELVVTFPPGDQIPDGAELAVEIETDAENPKYRKLVIPVRVIGGGSSRGG